MFKHRGGIGILVCLAVLGLTLCNVAMTCLMQRQTAVLLLPFVAADRVTVDDYAEGLVRLSSSETSPRTRLTSAQARALLVGFEGIEDGLFRRPGGEEAAYALIERVLQPPQMRRIRRADWRGQPRVTDPLVTVAVLRQRLAKRAR
ncbi:MAG: hypothetical protein FJX76_12940 [Armatimonadetes bacterium]|nr:hypothetical protein [Armatimonadota bacterium]